MLYHYVHIDVGQGVLVAAPGRPPSDPIMQAFRLACRSIHAVLQNTVRFRYAQSEMANIVAGHANKSASAATATHQSRSGTAMAIKEHGILMSMPDEAASDGCTEFWVIG